MEYLDEGITLAFHAERNSLSSNAPTRIRTWTLNLEGSCAILLHHRGKVKYLNINKSPDDTIRTCDPLLPKQVLYQAELHPDDGGTDRT